MKYLSSFTAPRRNLKVEITVKATPTISQASIPKHPISAYGKQEEENMVAIRGTWYLHVLRKSTLSVGDNVYALYTCSSYI